MTSRLSQEIPIFLVIFKDVLATKALSSLEGCHAEEIMPFQIRFVIWTCDFDIIMFNQFLTFLVKKYVSLAYHYS